MTYRHLWVHDRVQTAICDEAGLGQCWSKWSFHPRTLQITNVLSVASWLRCGAGQHQRALSCSWSRLISQRFNPRAACGLSRRRRDLPSSDDVGVQHGAVYHDICHFGRLPSSGNTRANLNNCRRNKSTNNAFTRSQYFISQCTTSLKQNQ